MRLTIICRRRPPSSNKGTENDIYREFGEELEGEYAAAGSPRFGDGLLYGLVYWFIGPYRSKDPDADNISKPIWDMLGSPKADTKEHEVRLKAYRDDKLVRLRLAGIFEIAPSREDAPQLEMLDLTGAPPCLTEGLDSVPSQDLSAVNRQSLTYIECGPLRTGMFVFDLGRETS